MFLLKQPWRYEFVEIEDGLLIIERDKAIDSDNMIELNGVTQNDETIKKPWTFMIDGMEDLYK